MKQKLLCLLAALTFILPARLSAFEYTYEGVTLKYEVTDEYEKTCMVSRNKDFTGALVIPDVANDGTTDYSVTLIGDYAFSFCVGLRSVVIGNRVEVIGDNAFLSCDNLTSVVIGNSVTVICSDAFYGCSGLMKSAYPNKLKNPFKSGVAIAYNPKGSIIEDGCVWGPEKSAIYFAPLSLEGEYSIPESVTSIGEYAFYGCSGLTSVVIPNSVTSIGEGPFQGCSGLTSVVIPNSVTSIRNYVFYGCSGLTSVVIGNSVTSIGEGAFHGCSGLTSVVIPNSVTSISWDAFSDCSGLTSVLIGNSVTWISDTAFKGCSGLMKSAYPNKLTNPFESGVAVAYNPEGACIEDGWIWGPEKTEIRFVPYNLEDDYTIPEYVTSIGANAFNGCSGLTSLTALTKSPAVMNDNSFEGLYDSVKLSVPDESVYKYLATNWSLFKNIGNSSGTEFKIYSDGVLEYRLNPTDMTAMVIGAKSFSNLQIPERFTDDSDAANPVRYYIKGIGWRAFDGKDVNSIEFNSRSQMEYIGDYAFANTSISSIALPETMKNIGAYAFYNASVSEVKFNEGLAYIGDYAFAETKISSISVPGSVSTIGDYAFYNTYELSKVEFKEGLESIGRYTFSAEKNRSVTGKPLYLPSTVKSVGMDAFRNFVCSQVDISDLNAWLNIDFGNESANPLYYKINLYVNDEKLTSLKVPEDIKEIKPFAFYNCKSLEEVTFPEGLEKIGTKSFYNCSNVTEVSIPASVVEIGNYVFGQSKVTFADGLLPISCGKEAFYNVTDLYCGRPVEGLTFSPGKVSTLIIGNLITEIPDSRFMDLEYLQTLSLGNSVEAIGNEAFSGCTSLAEVILPPSVETIGASAFAGNSKLESIIMGHKVKTIGEKAFDGCKANTVSITAQTPPTAPNNTFSNYTGKLYLQGEKAKDAYYDAFTCWDRFDSYVMIDAEEIKVEGADKISGKAGDTFQLTATVWPENVTLPQIFWRSTNPEIATVDENGLVTLHVDLESLETRAQGEGDIDGTCTIIAETLYNDGPVAQIGVDTTGLNVVEGITVGDNGSIDYSLPYDVYNMNGFKVAETTEGLAKGLYIIRQGKAAVKTVMK